MSDEKKIRFSKEWKIGVVSAAIIALFVWVCFFLAGRNILSSENTYFAVFQDTGGLNVSSPVVVNGKNVGRVSSIEFVSEADHGIKMGISVKKKYKINQGSVASIESLGLMSGSAVVIKLGNGSEFLKNGDFLEGQQVPGLLSQLEPLKGSLSSVLCSVDTIFKSLNATLNPKTVRDLSESFALLNESLKNVESLTAHVDDLIKNNEKRISLVLTNVESLSGELRHKQGDLANAISNFSALSDTLANAEVGESLRSLKASLQQAQTLLSKLNQGEGSAGRLLANDSLYRHLESSSLQLSLLLQDLRINPQRYVHLSLFGRKEKASQKPTK